MLNVPKATEKSYADGKMLQSIMALRKYSSITAAAMDSSPET